MSNAVSHQDWHDLGAVGALFGQDNCKGVEIGGLKIGLFRVESAIFAIDDLCTHGNALLSDGALEDFEVECPLHAGLFDVRSGKALCAPLTRDVRRHEVQIVGERLMVRLGGA